MNKFLNNLIKYTFFIGIAAFLLYISFRDMDFDAIKETIKKADYSWVIISILMGYAAVISRGHRWLLILKPLGYKPRFWSSVHAVGFGYMFNIFVPRGGELGRCGVMNKRENIPVDKLFGTVIMERAIDFMFLITTMILAFIFNVNEFFQIVETDIAIEQTQEVRSNFDLIVDGILFWGKQILFWTIATGIGAVAFAFLFFRQRILNHPKFEAVREFWNGIKQGISTIKKLENRGLFIAHTFFIWIMYFLMVYICFFSLTETSHLSLADGLFIMTAASLGIVIPAPGGIGAYHYLVTLAMVVLAVPQEIGLSFATIVHTSQTLMLLGAGLISLIYFGLSKSKKEKTQN